MYTKSEEQKRKFFSQICETIAALHEHDVAHYDVKPDNLMIDPATGDAVVIDFDRALFLDPSGNATQEILQITEKQTTPAYSPPSRWENPPKTRDVFSVGATALELFTGSSSLFEILSLNANLRDYMLNTTNQEISAVVHERIPNEPLKALLGGMLQIDPAKRLAMPQVLAHPYFN